MPLRLPSDQLEVIYTSPLVGSNSNVICCSDLSVLTISRDRSSDIKCYNSEFQVKFEWGSGQTYNTLEVIWCLAVTVSPETGTSPV